METLTEVLEEQVKDLYSAENQLLKALPRMAKKVTTPELLACYQKHLAETQGHVERLTKVGELLGIKLTGKVCAAMKGLVEEGKEVLEEDGKNPAIDAALIAASQRIEHYEIAAYGTVKALAMALGHDDLVEHFEATLEEEKATDDALTQVAEQNVYPSAQLTDEDEEENDDDDDDDDVSAKGAKGAKSSGSRTPPSRAQASKGGKNSAGKAKSR